MRQGVPPFLLEVAHFYIPWPPSILDSTRYIQSLSLTSASSLFFCRITVSRFPTSWSMLIWLYNNNSILGLQPLRALLAGACWLLSPRPFLETSLRSNTAASWGEHSATAYPWMRVAFSSCFTIYMVLRADFFIK